MPGFRQPQVRIDQVVSIEREPRDRSRERALLPVSSLISEVRRARVLSGQTVIIALAAAIAMAGCAPNFEQRAAICDKHRDSATLVTRAVIVYGTRTAAPATTNYYACLRPGGTSLYLGMDEAGVLYGSDATTGGLGAAGTYVIAQSSTGEASLAVCARYNISRRCTFAQHWLTVTDLATRRQAHIPIYTALRVPALVPFPVTVALSPMGALAWLQTAVLGAGASSRLQLWATPLKSGSRSTLTAAPSMIDSGAINPRSVRFDGANLYWVHANEFHRRRVR